MIQIVGPRLSQWDTGRRLSVTGSTATHAHMANKGDSYAPIIDIVNGEATIPDYLLQTGKELCVYLVLDGITQERNSFFVQKRERPENYVYEDDRRNYIYELITDAQTATEAANRAAETANNAANQALTAATNAMQTAAQAATNADTAANSAMAAAGRVDQAVNTANNAAENANKAADNAAHTAKALMVVGSARGNNISLDNAIDQFLVGLRICGKTTQNGTPTPENPVDLVSVGAGGSITVNITGKNDAQSMSIATPNGLPGIPVTSGGTYTDANGQQWICDEKDYANGVYVQRIGIKTLTGTEGYFDYISGYGVVSVTLPHADRTSVICSHALDGNGVSWASANSIAFKVSLFGCATMAEFVSYVAAQYKNGTPIKIAYVMPTPIETHLSEEELAAFATMRTYRGNTTVSNDAGAHMELEYVMDAKKYIDSQISAGILAATVE